MTFTLESFALTGRTALVIGGSSGIGREIALGYLKAGARVLIAGRDRAKLRKVAAELGAGTEDIALTADVRAVAAVARLAESIEARHGPVNILVNSQGTTAIKPALELTEEEYDTILDTNLKSVFFCCVEFGRRMVKRGEGVIVTYRRLPPTPDRQTRPAYGASKWGVASITQTFAAEWGDSGVRVNAIAPGFFLTDLNRGRMSESRVEQARARTAMKRMGAELVGAAVFLASDAARFINGATLRVDGGFLSSGI